MASSLPASSSWPAVTVTDCSVLQSESVKVRVVVDRPRSVPEWPEIVMVTSSVGICGSLTVNVRASPSFRAISSLLTTRTGMSLSSITTGSVFETLS